MSLFLKLEKENSETGKLLCRLYKRTMVSEMLGMCKMSKTDLKNVRCIKNVFRCIALQGVRNI